MNRAQAYIFRQVAVSTLFIVITLTAVIWLTQAMRFIRFILNKGLSLDVFFYITSLLLPSFLLITLPVSLFFAALFTLNKMTNDRELVVLRSSGMSHWQAAKPQEWYRDLHEQAAHQRCAQSRTLQNGRFP